MRWVVWAVAAFFKPKTSLVAENLCLRQQIWFCNEAIRGHDCRTRIVGSGFWRPGGARTGENRL